MAKERPPFAEMTRHQAQMEMKKRREEMIDEALKLQLDIDHWNANNPNDQIAVVLDLTEDVEELKTLTPLITPPTDTP